MAEMEAERARRREELVRRIEQEETDKNRVHQIMEENRRRIEEAQRKAVRHTTHTPRLLASSRTACVLWPCVHTRRPSPISSTRLTNQPCLHA